MSNEPVILSCRFNPSAEQYQRSIRFEDLDDAQEEAMHLFMLAKENLMPKVLLRELFIDEHVEVEGSVTRIRIGDVLLDGKMLRVLESSWRVIAYVATCGNGLESYDFTCMDMLAPYWLDVLKTQALEEVRRDFLRYCAAHYGMSTPSSINPGSGNLDAWPIQQLHLLFKLLGNVDAIGVRLTEHTLMVPNKTVAGLLFASKEMNYESCAYCERLHCPSRRVPYVERM